MFHEMANGAALCYHRAMPTTAKPRLSVRKAAGMGRGVFADERIRKGRVIETCPIIPLREAEEDDLSGTVLAKYLFAWGKGKRPSCIALGYGCLYNHSSKPNAVACTILSRNEIEFVALRDIEEGEQILIDYHWEEHEYDFPRDTQ